MRTRQVQRALPVIAVALLLLTAGCSFGGGDSTPTNGTATDGDTATTAGPATTTTEAVSLAGVEDGRVVDAAALADAHRQALAASSFETRRVQNASVVVSTGPNTSQVTRTTNLVQVVAEEGARPYRFRQSDSAVGFELQAWGNDSTRVFRALQGQEVVRAPSVGEPDPVTGVVSRNTVAGYLRAGNFTVAGSETVNGTTFVTLEADELAVENDSDLFVAGSSNYRNYSSTVVVDEDGVVRALDVSATYELRGERHDLSVSFEVLRLGTVTVEQPEWARRALAAATETDDPVGTGTPAPTGTPA
ncbi:hypothetical protein ACFPYI_04970 [Halomarina salina]|uniref:LppX_LprAFG lipoprotein n=1 Tax=Halomarina salina TaxID=1872699 RepID=A0ABD5RK23_9EURY|nr:hypothetical protein [Halomarina salina]